ncbi:lipocalin family protein [Loktanella sp. SALINAS62]|uniref:lipocalin family protein n=1 Tax=Loktanella sp. SALINAS62 TaxID=2706124 RepID=UPI001B8B579A|nr:lipocalin family protein [Loktanella sp. SALINAS62]MBS1303947.1 lipocalin family protein [Loktanella sp. SALINAS62]
MKRLALPLLVLVACGGSPDAPDDAPPLSFRDRTVPIASAALFQTERYQGTWYAVAGFPGVIPDGCQGLTATYGAVPGGDGLSVQHRCRVADGAVEARVTGRADVVGPGRLILDAEDLGFVRGDYWVLWVDEGYRTAVVGAPDGRSGWILDRSPDIPADRLAAAREVLDFNGYDLARLTEMPQ